MLLTAKKNKVKNVVIISFIMFIILPTLIVGFISVYFISKTLVEDVSKTHVNVVEQINLSIEREITRIDNSTQTLIMIESMQKLFKDISITPVSSRLLEIHKDINKSIIQIYDANNLPYSILIILDNDIAYSFRKRLYLDKNSLIEQKWYKDTLSLSGKTNWIGMMECPDMTSNSKYIFSMSRQIVDLETYKPFGMVFVCFEEELFSDILQKALDNTDSDIYVVDKNNNVLMSNNYDHLGQLINNILRDEVLDNTASGVTGVLKDKKYSVIYSGRNSYGWRVIQLLPTKAMYDKILYKAVLAFTLLMICFLVFLVFLHFIYDKIIKPIEDLSLKFSVNEDYNIAKSQPYTFYEFNKISNDMFYLFDKSETLSNELSYVKEMELYARIQKLQAKINPHFLYNTLNSIKILATMSNDNRIGDTITSLIKILKGCINREGEFVTVEKEVDTLLHYINIEKMIYKDSFEVVNEFDDSLNHYQMPNFILQPIVENALFHGIDTSKKGGCILLRNRVENNNLIFTIEDNGIGMDEQKIKDILSFPKENHKYSCTSLGIMEIDKRIKLLFGEEFGLSITSEINKGTKVTIKIPCIVKGGNQVDKCINSGR
jgi:two-component system sensor histidine kinase YesM